MKTGKIQNDFQILNGIKAKRLPVKLSFVLARNLKKLQDVVQDFEAERNKLVEKYAERDESGEIITGENGSVNVSDMNAFIAELSTILETDVDITLDGITEADIEKCDEDGYDKLTVEEVGILTEWVDRE